MPYADGFTIIPAADGLFAFVRNQHSIVPVLKFASEVFGATTCADPLKMIVGNDCSTNPNETSIEYGDLVINTGV